MAGWEENLLIDVDGGKEVEDKMDRETHHRRTLNCSREERGEVEKEDCWPGEEGEWKGEVTGWLTSS